ncbi:MAG TPA: membrane protein insertase YidC, partial [Leucothrix mucor]|nr:membrane protein insertase YidC [Leucothrix mucor]
FMGLYWVLLEAVELRQAPWLLWYQDLSIRDPYFILPIIMGASMWFQQKLNPPMMQDPMQQKIFTYLPLVFTVMFSMFPAGLVLYWVVNSILGIAQQWYITRKILAEDG